MRFLTLEDCSDSELHCIYHDPERTITILQPRTSCSLQIYAPEVDRHTAVSTYQSSRSNSTHAWWLQLLGITGSQLLGTASNLVEYAVSPVSLPEPDSSTLPVIDRELIRHHLTNCRSVIPHHDTLDEEEHIESVQPLPSPWTFPLNTRYREARRGYLEHLSEPLIAELVTHGLLIASDIGIRWKHLDQYILVKTDEPSFDRANRPRLNNLDLAAFQSAKIRCLGLVEELNGMQEERSGTPIVELGSPPLGVGEKRVRLYPKRKCVLINGDEIVVKVEDLEDNEGKTAMSRAREAEKVKKQ